MTETKTTNGARFIAETLKGYGVTHVFYVDAMLRKAMVELEELGIRRVVTHSEKAAAYHGRWLCLHQWTGWGLHVAIGRRGKSCRGLAGCLPCQQPSHRADRQETAALAVSQLIPGDPSLAHVRTRHQIQRGCGRARAIAAFAPTRTFRETVSGKPAPVHLDMVGREARELELASIAAPVSVDERFVQYPPFRPAPDADAIEAAARAIESAQRPIIVAGGGVRISRAVAELVALAEKRQIPVATSVDGKGSIPETHPLSVGVAGNYSAWCANKAVCESDLVIYVGSATGDQTTNSWKVPAIGTPIVQIDIDPAELGRNYPKGFFGRACSPLVESNLLILNIGGRDGAGVVAFHCATGARRWKATDGEASYASPVATTFQGRRIVLSLTREALVALSPADGRAISRYPWRPRLSASVSAATPLVIGDLIFISASYGAGASLLRFKDSGPEVIWSRDGSLSNHYATSVQHGGFLYGWHGRQETGCELRCVDLQTVNVRWADPGEEITVSIAGQTKSAKTGADPLVLASGAGKASRHSVGTTVFGGMILSTVLNLLFIPVLYVLVRTATEGARARAAVPARAPGS